MKKTILFMLLLILFLLPANFSQAAELTEINEQNFPSQALRDFAGKIVTHQIIKIDTEKGKRVFHTKGIANTIEDPLVEESQVLGKVIMKSNILSFISKIVNNPYGFYFVIFVPFAILLVMEIIDFVEEKKDSKK